jgi:hypothetical protein
MTRLVPVTLLVVLAASRVASADMGTLPDGATLTWANLYIRENGALKEPSDPDARRYYFNRAHCVCSKANLGDEKTFQYLLKLDKTINTVSSLGVEFWVGTGCENDEALNNASMCRKLDDPDLSDINDVARRETRLEFSTYEVIVGANAGGDCPNDEGKVKPIFLLADTDTANMQRIDYSLVKNIGQPPGDTAAGVDTSPPPLPTNFAARSSDGGILLSWTVPESRGVDIYAYQALCAGPDGMPVKSSAPKARYVTSKRLCDIADDALTPSPASGGENDSPVTALPAGLAALDPAFICGEQMTGTADQLSISDLVNGTPYTVVLLATDLYGNFAGTYFMSTITPRPATDFWEDLHDRGSQAEGGFCMATRSADSRGLWSMFAVVASAWWLVRRKVARRSMRKVASASCAGLAVAVVLLMPRASQAQGGYQPYWQNTDPDSEPELAPGDPALVSWHAGIRVGPYIPDIDNQLGMNPGPYEQMFGGSRILPMLDVDRILWTGFGQFGVGISAGYMQKSANSFVDGSDPNDPNRPRSPGDTNTFRLLPTALTATYRFTALDDLYGIPIVPYARGGLAYYVWWLSSTGSAVCKDGGMPPDCEKNPPRGGSLGFTGSIGIAIRAERVDPSTAMSMQQSGIQHAGVYAELSMAKVDGFGSDTKLSVGDSTWFAGVNFEF